MTSDKEATRKKAKASPKYESVVFLSAFVVPTIPLLDGEIGDPDGAGFVTGQYVGMADPKKDIAARIELIQADVDQVYDLSTSTRDDPSVLHVFLVPEFYFRGSTGAYASDPRCILDIITFAIEICLDHRWKRVRTVLDEILPPR